jgi:hypothetical protein
MNRRSIFTLTAITALGLAVLPSSIVAQQGALRQQVVGFWTLVSCDSKQPFCVNPSGSFSVDASGRYIWMFAARDRPKATTINRPDVTPEEYKALAQGVTADFGTWSVSEGDKTMTLALEGDLFPNQEGRALRFSVGLTGAELKLVDPGGSTYAFRRAK